MPRLTASPERENFGDGISAILTTVGENPGIKRPALATSCSSASPRKAPRPPQRWMPSQPTCTISSKSATAWNSKTAPSNSRPRKRKPSNKRSSSRTKKRKSPLKAKSPRQHPNQTKQRTHQDRRKRITKSSPSRSSRCWPSSSRKRRTSASGTRCSGRALSYVAVLEEHSSKYVMSALPTYASNRAHDER